MVVADQAILFNYVFGIFFILNLSLTDNDVTAEFTSFVADVDEDCE